MAKKKTAKKKTGMKKVIATWYQSEPELDNFECPYCGEFLNEEDDEYYEIIEPEEALKPTKVKCNKCGKHFILEIDG